jgi:hypothetical protein
LAVKEIDLSSNPEIETPRSSQWFEGYSQWESILNRLMQTMPVSLAVRELHRMIKFGEVMCRWDGVMETVLDVGCGDGSWWQAVPHKRGRIYG